MLRGGNFSPSQLFFAPRSVSGGPRMAEGRGFAANASMNAKTMLQKCSGFTKQSS